MWKQKIQKPFIIFAVLFLTSCGVGLSIQDTVSPSTDGSSSSLDCPTFLSELSSSNKLSSFNSFSSKQNKSVTATKVFLSKKLQITSSQFQKQSEQISLSLSIDKQCASFSKSFSLSKNIIRASSTKNIPSLNQQNYAFSILKSQFTNFQKQVEQDYCIKQVGLNRTFTLMKPIPPTPEMLEKQLQYKASISSKHSLNKTSSPSEYFNDPFLFRQSHLWAISFFSAFKKIYKSTDGKLIHPNNSNKTIVAIVDTPVYEEHEDLKNGLFINPNIRPIKLDVNKDHGTHIAGLIAANTNNILGTVGLASNSVRLESVGVISDESNGKQTFFESNLKNQLNAIKNLSTSSSSIKPQVINLSLSLSGVSCSPPTSLDVNSLSGIIKDLLDSGVSIVVAAGNEDETLSKSEAKYYPACLSHDPRFKKLIVVGSVDIDNKNNIEGKSKFSNYSPEYVHIAAPGNSPLGGLYSTISSNKYGWKAGTSQATPLVTSAVALTYAILNQPRTTINDQTQTVFDKCKINEKNRPEVIKKIILDSATKRNDMISYWKDGNVLNLSKLIDYIHLIFPDTKKN